MTKLFESLAAKATGFNWYKWGAIVAVLVAALVLSYGTGRNHGRLACEQEKREKAEQKVVAITRYVTERVAEVQVKEVKSRKELEEIARLKRRLDDEINKREDLPECALSDSEFDAVNELLKK